MSERHPIIAITGSSGAGTTSVTRTFENIFRREGVNAAIIEGDSFHRYDRKDMKTKAAEATRHPCRRGTVASTVATTMVFFKSSDSLLARPCAKLAQAGPQENGGRQDRTVTACR